MAVVLIEGFDHLSAAQMSLKGWNSDSGTVIAGRFGGQALSSLGTITGFGKVLPGSYTTAVCGFAFKNNQGASSNPQFAFRNGAASGGTVVVAMRFVTSGPNTVLGLYNAAGTQLALGTTPYPGLTTWVYAEIKVVVSATVGTVELRLNGAPTAECSATGVNTGALDITSVSWQWVNGGAHYLDDIYVTDTTGPAPNNGFLGDIRVDYLVPTAAGAKTNFTPSAAANWQTVDETTPSDADYNSSYVPGAVDLFTMADLASNGVVYAVQTNLRAAKSDAGFRTVKPVFYEAAGSGDTPRFYPGARSGPLSNSYQLAPRLYDTSPDTAAAWSAAEINALQFGYMVGEASMFTLDARLV